MPTLSLSAALLVLGNTEGLPWNSSTWQALTKIVGPPWETPDDAAPGARASNHTAWTVATAQSVKAYARSLWSKSSTAQIQYSSRTYTDNDAFGRDAWNSFTRQGIRSWKLNLIVDGVFKECKVSAYEAVARAKSKLPTLEDAQVESVVRTPLASTLFGDDAFGEDGLFLCGPIKDFCDALIVNTWNRYRKGLVREGTAIKKNRMELDAAWAEISDKGSKLPIKTLKTYLERVRKQLTLLQRYEDKNSIEEVENMHKQLKALLAEAQNDEGNMELRNTLPKVLRDALNKLASAQDVQHVEHLVNAALEHVNTDENSGTVELPEGPELKMDWTEGVEDLQCLTENQLWDALGFNKDKALPFFQTWNDPDAVISPWSKEGAKWLADPDNSSRHPLRPRWHQLVGIFRMLQRAFNGEPVLLMDGVGIGKTFQVIGFIACLAYYQPFYEMHGKFPGYFADKKWHREDGNIPSEPFVIACPVNLHSQWTRELERFLLPHSFDILPYTGKFATRGDWWDKIPTQSHHQGHHRIILATESAIQDDASTIFVDLLRDVEGEIKHSAAYSSRARRTIYGHEYLGFIIDEAHTARKFNKIHTAYHALRMRSNSLVAMTATPVMTKLQDLWIMGSMMGISTFKSKLDFKRMTTEFNRAQAKDRKVERESEDAGDRLRALLAGEDVEQVASNSALAPRMREWVPWIRNTFAPYVIRRTLDSKDSQGDKIFGLPPYQDHTLLLELRDWEKKRLMAITDEIIDQGQLTTLAGAGKNFYIEFRRSLLHPHMNPRGGDDSWVTPTSLDNWKTERASTKLDALAQIVAHHHAQDNAPPVKINADGQTLEFQQVEPLGPHDGKQDPDRIIIFSLFPSSNSGIKEVLHLYGIKALELNSRTPLHKRKSVLEAFRASTREAGSRVLILSMVGTVGLNLACANVMIIADTLWSALDDEQLRGRIYRYPQKKTVHFYRLVARGTPDVFLNNIAFDKGMLHQAFVGIDSHSLQLFTGNEDDDDPTKTIDSDDDDDDAMIVVDQPAEPKARQKHGTKKALSPTRPPTKRAFTSPGSPTPAPRPLLKKAKQRKEQKKVAGKGQIKEKQQPSASLVPHPTVSAAGPSGSASATTAPAPTELPTERTRVQQPAAYDPGDDPILRQISNDPYYEKDPEELDAIAAAGLMSPTAQPTISLDNSSDRLSSFPSLSSAAPPMHDISTGVLARANAIAIASSSISEDTIGGVTLVPGGKGSFKGGARTAQGKGRGRTVKKK